MPISTSSFGIVRGHNLTTYVDNSPYDGKYRYVKSFQIADYKLLNQTVTYYADEEAEQSHIFTVNSTTEYALASINDELDEYAKFDYGSIKNINDNILHIKFSSGIANRLGFLSNKTYNIPAYTTITSDYRPITTEPAYFILRIDGEDEAVIYPDANNKFEIDYPLFEPFRNGTPRVDVRDNNGNEIDVPCTFQITYVDDYKDVNFRTRGISHYESNTQNPIHQIMAVTENLAVKNVLINDDQIFSGDEYVQIKTYEEITGNGTIDDDNNFIPSTDGTQTTCVKRYDANDNSKYFKFNTDGIIDDNNLWPKCHDDGDNITSSYIPMTAGALNESHFIGLYENSGFTIDSLNIEDQDITITFVAGIYALSSTNPKIQTIFPCDQVPQHVLNFTCKLPIGQRAPLYYMINFRSREFVFSNTMTNLIEWMHNDVSSMAEYPIQLSSYDAQGEKIRELTPREFVTMFIYR